MTRADFIVIDDERNIGLHPGTGERVLLDTVPEGEFEGDDIEYELDDVEFGYDVEGDDDFGDDEIGEDEIGEDEIGARRRRGRRGGEGSRKDNRKERRQARDTKDWEVVYENGIQTLGGAGTATVTIRIQDDFLIDDIFFEGTLAATVITSVKLGNDTIFSNSTGLPITLFAPTSFARGQFKGHMVPGGRDIVVVGTLTGAGSLAVQFLGKRKPKGG